MDNRTDVRKLGQGIVGMLRLFWGITLLLLLAGQAWGQAVWDGTTSEPGKDGNGSYLITTAEELAWVAEQVNSGKDNFSGKTIYPLCTNEGSGLGRSVGDIQKLCPGAQVGEGLSVHGAEAAQSQALIRQWAEKTRG